MGKKIYAPGLNLSLAIMHVIMMVRDVIYIQAAVHMLFLSVVNIYGKIGHRLQ